MTGSQLVPPGLGPLLVERVREQVTRVARHRLVARGTVPGADSRLGPTLEPGDVGLDVTAGEQVDPAAAQHHGVLPAEGLPGMVCGLPQVGGARVGLQVRPQRLDDLLAHEPVTIGQGEKLNELRGPATRPRGVRDLPAPDRDRETPEQHDVHTLTLRVRRHHHSYRVVAR